MIEINSAEETTVDGEYWVRVGESNGGYEAVVIAVNTAKYGGWEDVDDACRAWRPNRESAIKGAIDAYNGELA